MVNNLRDIPTDTLSGKRTVAVRLGDRWSRRVYVGLVLGALSLSLLVLFVPWPRIFAGGMLQWGGGFVVQLSLWIGSLATMKPVLGGAKGPELLPVLRNTGLLTLAYGALLGLLFALV